MSEPDRRMLAKMRVEYPVPISLHSGGLSKVKYEIGQLTLSDLYGLARCIDDRGANSVWSIGGGMWFAGRFQFPFSPGGDCLVVDDVCTTGKTLRGLAAQVRRAGGKVIKAVVIVQRGPVPDFDFPFEYLFQVPAELEGE